MRQSARQRPDFDLRWTLSTIGIGEPSTLIISRVVPEAIVPSFWRFSCLSASDSPPTMSAANSILTRATAGPAMQDRKRAVQGRSVSVSVDRGGGRIIKNKKNNKKKKNATQSTTGT